MIIVGWLEQLSLPEFGLSLLAKVDTGAQTSCLHATGVRYSETNNEVSFYCGELLITSPAIDRRDIKSSSGHIEHRWVVETAIQLGEEERIIQLTLSDRTDMRCPMLLGRQAMQGIYVEPVSEFKLGPAGAAPIQMIGR